MKNLLIEYWPFIIGAIETTVRVIPTKKNLSPLHSILKGVLFLSNLLNNKTKSLNDVVKIVTFIVCLSALISCGISKNLDCVSKKQITITVIDKNGNYNTTKVSYCDTVRVAKPVDSTTRVKFVPTKEVKETN